MVISLFYGPLSPNKFLAVTYGFFCRPHSRVVPGHWFLLLPIKLPLCSITIPSPEKPSIPSATDRALCVCLSLAPPPQRHRLPPNQVMTNIVMCHLCLYHLLFSTSVLYKGIASESFLAAWQ
ncbi:hypothetical protein Hanom_Chr06g00485101 [Helianthus anomalus]